MNPLEIRDKMMAGELTPAQAKELFDQARAGKEVMVHKPPPIKPRLSQRVGPIENIDDEHFYQRALLEEHVRHGTALMIYGMVGLVDGVLDGIAYGVSEITEDITFGVTRVLYRAKDGIARGKQ
jgi:hypothetical protein